MTEDVIFLGSPLKTRVNRSANAYELSLKQLKKARDKTLDYELRDEIGNMFGRIKAGDARITKRNRKETAAPALRNRTFDETFNVVEKGGDYEHTEEILKDYLRLCDEDRKLFLQAYAKALELVFPILNPRFEWRPVFGRTRSGQMTIIHKWGIKKPAPKPIRGLVDDEDVFELLTP